MRNVLTSVVLICPLLIPFFGLQAQERSSKAGIRVEVVATATEYVPRTTTVSHPGHSYTDCSGTTSYFGRFDDDTGRLSGTADTNTRCNTTFTALSESTLTTYRRVNYTIAKNEHTLYLLSCTQDWRLSPMQRLIIGHESAEKAEASGAGRRTDCPAFSIGAAYTLTVRNASDARLASAATRKPIKLEYLSSAALPGPNTEPPSTSAFQPQVASTPTVGPKVHITSSPSGGEIYVDGRFFGSTPSDITLSSGEHTIKITAGGKEWTRTVQITAGEISVHAEIP